MGSLMIKQWMEWGTLVQTRRGTWKGHGLCELFRTKMTYLGT